MSTLLEKASLVMIPSGYKEDVVYSEIPTDGSGDIQFTRASDGTRVNSQGLVERVPWNLLEQSNTFSTTWTLNNVNVTSGQSGYDGTNNAWSLSKTAANGEIRQTVLSGLRTFSVYAKAGSLNWLRFLKGGNAGQYFNLSTGQVGTGNAQVISANIQSVGGGWYLCSMVYNDAYDGSLRIYPADADNDTSGTSGNIYIQDAQLNQGSTAKPYFPTTDRQNVPRLDYSGGCPSLLLEPQRTNLVTYSENLDAVFVPTNITQTANYGTSPDGNLTSTRLELDNLTNSRTVETFTGIVSSGVTYTFSCYYKGINGETTYMYFLDSNGITSVAKKITFTGEWQRESITFVAGTASNYTYIVDVRQGTSTATDFEVWGAQVEAGSYPTSYIPTTSASVTRVADEAYKTGISSLIGQTEGVLFVDFVYNSKSGTNRLSISDGTTNNWIFIGTPEDSANDGSRFYIKTNGSVAVDVGSSSYFTIGQRYKLAIAYKSGDWAVYGNGTLLYSGTSSIASVSSPLSVFNFFSITGVAGAAENINQTVLFKTRLTNAELASLTSL